VGIRRDVAVYCEKRDLSALSSPFEELPEREVPVELTRDERKVLWWGLNQWGGPVSMLDSIARMLWFAGRSEFVRERDRLAEAIRREDPLSPRDWHRVLAATELAFSSWTLGAAGNWTAVTGIDDHTTLDHIRSIQLKVASVRPWPTPYARPQCLPPDGE
jgi:hypothetical protein